MTSLALALIHAQSCVVGTLAGQAGNAGHTDGWGSIAQFNGSSCVAVDTANNLYVADTGNRTIRMVTPSKRVFTVAGGAIGNADGTGDEAHFDSPSGIAVDRLGNIYVADTLNDTIRVARIAAPTLYLTVTSGKVQLTWPSSASGFLLETTPNLAPAPSWTVVTNGIVTVGPSNILSITPVAPQVFYRLMVP